eukprot:6181760-Pleurochrysis_carterae.AAC.1
MAAAATARARLSRTPRPASRTRKPFGCRYPNAETKKPPSCLSRAFRAKSASDMKGARSELTDAGMCVQR